MSHEFKDDPSFVAWGPFIPPHYQNEEITVSDIIIASVVFGLTMIFSIFAVYLGIGQTKGSHSAFKSTYVWLIWVELVVCFVMAVECFLHLLKIIKPSFAFYFTILFWWCIQVQLLLQIIINRIRVIVPDRALSRRIMWGTAAIVTAINISVFNIWIPARLQISSKFIHINEIWDRVEKVLYLILDAMLNAYFLKTVKANLINNGLQKYNKLLRFNQRIIVISLLMDVMIIAAMSIPNSFVYIQFHPLAYLVKLNIEMTMANLIKRIAISKARRPGHTSAAREFDPEVCRSLSHSGGTSSNPQRSAYIELTAKPAKKAWFGSAQLVGTTGGENPRASSFVPTGSQIKKTREIVVKSEPNPDYDEDKRRSERKNQSLTAHPQIKTKKSLDDVSDCTDSIDGRRKGDSDDEMVLVNTKKYTRE